MGKSESKDAHEEEEDDSKAREGVEGVSSSPSSMAAGVSSRCGNGSAGWRWEEIRAVGDAGREEPVSDGVASGCAPPNGLTGGVNSSHLLIGSN